MNEFTKKAAYLKGYISALEEELGDGGKKITRKLLELIEEMAEKVDDMSMRLEEVEDEIYDFDDEEPSGDDGDPDDDDYDFDDEELDDSETDLFEIQCTECGEDFTIGYDDVMNDETIRCPHCDARIELAIDFDDSDDKDWDF